LSEDEVRRAAAACRAHAAALGLPLLRFNTIALQEPPKQQLLQYESGALRQLPRLSLCILQTPPHFMVYEATVDLQPQHSTGAAAAAAAAVVSWTKVS
jgi:Cu2+-containing amine oxidase